MFKNNPIVQIEFNYLRRGHSPNATMYGVMLGVVFNIAIIPLWLYIDVTLAAVLLAMIIALWIVNMGTAIRHLQLAAYSMKHQQETVAWEQLVVTGISARQFIVGKWWAIFRCVWKDYLLVAILQCGVALGAAQYLHMIPYMDCMWQLRTNALCVWGRLPPTYPELYTIGVAIIFSLIFAITEATLMNSLILCVFVSRRSFRQLKVIFVRVIMAIGFFVATQVLIQYWLNATGFTFNSYPAYSMDYYHATALEAAEFSLFTMVDHGVTLAAGVMRPTTTVRHTMRHVLSALVALILYAMCCGFSIMLAKRQVTKRGLASR